MTKKKYKQTDRNNYWSSLNNLPDIVKNEIIYKITVEVRDHTYTNSKPKYFS